MNPQDITKCKEEFKESERYQAYSTTLLPVIDQTCSCNRLCPMKSGRWLVLQAVLTAAIPSCRSLSNSCKSLNAFSSKLRFRAISRPAHDTKLLAQFFEDQTHNTASSEGRFDRTATTNVLRARLISSNDPNRVFSG